MSAWKVVGSQAEFEAEAETTGASVEDTVARQRDDALNVVAELQRKIAA